MRKLTRSERAFILTAAGEAPGADAALARGWCLSGMVSTLARYAQASAAVCLMVAAFTSAGCATAERTAHGSDAAADGHPHDHRRHHHHHHGGGRHHHHHHHLHRHGDDHHHHHDHHAHHHDHHDHHHAYDGAHGDLHPEHDRDAPCACAAALRLDRWCRSCNIGFIAGVPVSSAILFSTLDPHGHDIDPATIDCADCHRALAEDGWCETCDVGYIRTLTYFTRLTHGIAKGRSVDAASLKCESCASNAKSPAGGWCDACRLGMVGNVRYANRKAFDVTVREFETFHRALEKANECEVCACAMVMYRTCPHCRIHYARDDGAE